MYSTLNALSLETREERNDETDRCLQTLFILVVYFGKSLCPRLKNHRNSLLTQNIPIVFQIRARQIYMARIRHCQITATGDVFGLQVRTDSIIHDGFITKLYDSKYC